MEQKEQNEYTWKELRKKILQNIFESNDIYVNLVYNYNKRI